MKLTILAGVAILLPAASWAQAFDAKPGLWETTSSTTIGGGAVQIPPEKLAQLPPEQRKMIESMSQGRTTTNTSKVCLTKESLEKGFTPGQMTGSSNCTQKMTTMTSSKIVVHMECTAQGMIPAASGDVTIERIDSEHAKGTIAISSASGRGGMNSTFTTKYIGADCGDVKPTEFSGTPAKK
ncbi:MAG TPA: DUF3617 domain-containing protein [Verrucomicrobiae bacterium]|nr:DUF3617 domain-containing protein [Verrucomicrobiae bacterium]